MWEVARVLGDRRCLVLKNHGFISLGDDMREAGELALMLREAVLHLSLERD
jgi:rhamnose utilization protein RhaD (predicted bifunctional aldolase and dehydrogenase)